MARPAIDYLQLPAALHLSHRLVLCVHAYVLAVILCGPSAAAQTGFPAFNSFQNNGLDSINEGTLNLHAEFVVARADEIGLPFAPRITFDGGSGVVWSQHWNGRNQEYEWAGGQGGWSSIVPIPAGWLNLSQQSSNGYCGTFSGSYTDEHNTVHTFSSLVLTAQGSQTLCSAPTTTGGALDGSGYIISDTNADGQTGGCNAVVTDLHGNTITGNNLCLATAVTIADPNGNSIESDFAGNTATYKGSLGTTILNFNAQYPTYTYSFTGGNGAVSSSLHYSTISWATNFGCGEPADVNGTFNKPDTLTLADGSVYTFQYDSQGFLNQVNLPQGGYIKYTYIETVSCSAGTVTLTGLTRTTYDNKSQISGQWTYTQTGTPAGSTTTELAPSGDQQVVKFQNYSEVDRKIYTGTNSLLKEIVHCYNYTSAAPCNTQTGANSSGSAPKALTVLAYLNGGTSAAQTVTYYGNTAPYVTGLQLTVPTEIDSYDFGASSPTKKVLTPTGSWNGSSCDPIGNNILDRPCEINVMDSANNVYSSTTISYSTAGNPTAVSRSAGSRWLTTQYFYDTNGAVSKIVDPNGSYIKFTNKTCGPAPYAYPQNINAYTAGGTLLPYPSYTLTYDPYCNSSKPFTVTDANGQQTSYIYNDPLWRPTSVKDPLQNTTGISYTSSSVESVLSFGTSTVDSLTTLDGLGRLFLSQTKEGPGSSSYDTVVRGYDANSRLTSVGLPCVSTASQPCTSSTTTFTYDGSNRPKQQTDGGNGSISTTYPNNDVLVTLGPPPAGENLKSVQTQYDGLGRPTSTCQIISGSTNSCGQNSTGYGQLTSYAYSTFANGAQVSATRGVQTRTSVYDALGRVTQETTPESGTVTSVYDSEASCGSYGFYRSLGDLVHTTDARGMSICYFYDVLHRVTDIGNSSQGATNPCKRFRYDNSTGVLGSIPSGITVSNTMGRLVEAETDNCSTPITQSSMITDEWFSYDKDGRLTDVYELTPHSGGYYHTTVGYFPNGLPSSLSGLPGLSTYTYNVDGEGRSYSAVSGTTTFINGVTYNAASQPKIVQVGSAGDQDTYTYDPATGRMKTYTFTINSFSETGTLTWNANGTLRKLAVTDGFNAGGTQTCTFGTSGVMGYDDLGRLLSDNCGSSLWNQTFSYDPYDNITKTGNPGITWNPGYVPGTNQYIGATYDAAGDILYDLTNSYTWDVYGKMASARASTNAAVCGTNGTCVTYDALGRAVEKNVSGAFSEILYSPFGKTAIMSGQTLTNAYVPMPGGQSSLWDNTGGHHVEHHDWRGSVVLRSSLKGRSVDYDRAYAAFGELYDNFGSNVNLNFTGDTQDLFSGLFDTPARELVPTQGRWLSPDPAGAGWNPYAYVSNNPLGLTDPSGLCADCVHHWDTFDARLPVSDCGTDPHCVVYMIDGMVVSPQAFGGMILGQGGNGLEFAFAPGSGIAQGSWQQINVAGDIGWQFVPDTSTFLLAANNTSSEWFRVGHVLLKNLSGPQGVPGTCASDPLNGNTICDFQVVHSCTNTPTWTTNGVIDSTPGGAGWWATYVCMGGTTHCMAIPGTATKTANAGPTYCPNP